MKRIFSILAVAVIAFAACTTDVTKDVTVEVPETLTVSFEESSRIQLNDDFAEVGDIRDYIYQEREAMPERDKPFMRVSMKIDQDTQMGLVTDVKMKLREAWALNIVYSGGKRK